MGHHAEVFVGIDTSKSRNAIAIADGGRGGEIRYLGEFPATEAAIRKLVAKLAAKCCHLTFCYEAAPTGSGRSARAIAPATVNRANPLRAHLSIALEGAAVCRASQSRRSRYVVIHLQWGSGGAT